MMSIYRSKLILVSCFLSLLLLLQSCESHQEISILFLDQDSEEKLDSVLITISAGKNGEFIRKYGDYYSDSSGLFKTSIMIGCASGCDDVKLNFNKDGYHLTQIVDVFSDTIYLKSNK